MRPDPVSVTEAATRLHREPHTIYSWATRYGVRRWGDRRATLYDFADLATIEACINKGIEVPTTPEARDALRASYASAACPA
ncbi:hypothetical protein [Sphaerisporangium sp. NPDC051011]|uniref:hypothetical protein n=1 Tax=Sphaerisporangium sp. NPDC051011 TaxID=3155792 RepID=UPI0033C00CC3